jgi:dGTPase
MAIQLKSVAETEDYGQNLKPGERAPAAYAASAITSRGRFHDESECSTRSPFQRDRDRVLHSTAFRRLTYKTQVFLPHEGDHYRTRLTHSLEVAQIARTIARQLRLDEDLAETIALAHDLGHSPFGHAGERALDTAMKGFGGFDHNAQSLRLVTTLERKYLSFDGLNLTWETLEGLAKHNGPVPVTAPVAKVVRAIDQWRSLALDRWASAEAQVASLADDIAYLSHDVDDGLRAGLLSVAGLSDVSLAGPIAREVLTLAQGAEAGRAIYEVTRRMITAMVADIVDESRRRFARLNPASPDDIRGAGRATIAFSEPMTRDMSLLKSFLFEAVYHNRRVLGVMERAEQIVRDLFGRYNSDNGASLPEGWRDVFTKLDASGQARLACDFLAGQTDRYALAEHRRLFAATPELR